MSSGSKLYELRARGVDGRFFGSAIVNTRIGLRKAEAGAVASGKSSNVDSHASMGRLQKAISDSEVSDSSDESSSDDDNDDEKSYTSDSDGSDSSNGVDDSDDDGDDAKNKEDIRAPSEDSEDSVTAYDGYSTSGATTESIPLTPRGRYSRRKGKAIRAIKSGNIQSASRRGSLAAVVGVTTMLRRMSLTATTLGRRAVDEMRAVVGSASSSPRAYVMTPTSAEDSIQLTKPATFALREMGSGSGRSTDVAASGVGHRPQHYDVVVEEEVEEGTASAESVASMPSLEDNFLTSANLCRWVIDFDDLHLGMQVHLVPSTLAISLKLTLSSRVCCVCDW
jgi:hypothetical protein